MDSSDSTSENSTLPCTTPTCFSKKMGNPGDFSCEAQKVACHLSIFPIATGLAKIGNPGKKVAAESQFSTAWDLRRAWHCVREPAKKERNYTDSTWIKNQTAPGVSAYQTMRRGAVHMCINCLSSAYAGMGKFAFGVVLYK